MFSTLGVVFRGAIRQQKGDLVQPDPLGLQLADGRDALDVRQLVQAEVPATSTGGSQESQSCIEVHGSSADTGAGGYLTNAKEVFAHRSLTAFGQLCRNHLGSPFRAT
jgi:hypothetical protein